MLQHHLANAVKNASDDELTIRLRCAPPCRVVCEDIVLLTYDKIQYTVDRLQAARSRRV